LTTARAYSGSYSFGSPEGDELVAAMTSTDPLPVEAGEGLSFWTWYETQPNFDMAIVEVSLNGRSFDVLDTFTGTSGGWVQKTYPLEEYVGHSIYIRFRYTTDSYVTLEGFYVDDILPAASWSTVTTLWSGTGDTSYQVSGRDPGAYFYRARGANPEHGFGDYSELAMTCVPYSSDLNLDCHVGLDDFVLLFACTAGPEVPADLGCIPADLDGDGDVDLHDFAKFQEEFAD
jgi:hypothetical protein